MTTNKTVAREKLTERLMLSMNHRKMRAAELARRAGIARSSITQYISGYYSPGWDSIYSLAQALNVPPAWLAGYDDETLPDFLQEETPVEKFEKELIATLYYDLSPADRRKVEDYAILLAKSAGSNDH